MDASGRVTILRDASACLDRVCFLGFSSISHRLPRNGRFLLIFCKIFVLLGKKCHFPTKSLVQSKSWIKQTGSGIQFCFRWVSIQTSCLFFKRVKCDEPDITLISFTFWLNMVPASGRNLSGGWNHAGSFSYDLISSGILLELDFFKIHIIGWSPNAQNIFYDTTQESQDVIMLSCHKLYQDLWCLLNFSVLKVAKTSHYFR